jgi:hypothetical protein
MRPGRLHRRSPENDIRDVVSSDAFRDLVRDRGNRRIWVEDQLTHPFPFHALPELPAADLYWDKWSRLLELGDGSLAFGGGNGSGFVPTPMVDLVLRQMFWETRDDRETVLRRVAARWFGGDQAAAVRRAWWTCSQSLREHAQVEKYVSRAAYIEPLGLENSNLTDENAMSTRLLRARWTAAVDEIERAAAAAPAARRRLAMREADLARATEVGVVSLDHAMRAAELTRELRRTGAGLEAVRGAILTVTRNEIANVDSAIALASRRPLLRRHPFYRNRFELEVLVEKRRALERQLDSIETR